MLSSESSEFSPNTCALEEYYEELLISAWNRAFICVKISLRRSIGNMQRSARHVHVQLHLARDEIEYFELPSHAPN